MDFYGTHASSWVLFLAHPLLQPTPAYKEDKMPDVINVVKDSSGQLYIDVDGNQQFREGVDIAIPEGLVGDIQGILGNNNPMSLVDVVKNLEKKYEEDKNITPEGKKKLEELQGALDGKIEELKKKQNELADSIDKAKKKTPPDDMSGLRTQLDQVNKQLDALQKAKEEVDGKLKAWNDPKAEQAPKKEGQPKEVKAAVSSSGGTITQPSTLPGGGGGFGGMSFAFGTPGAPGFVSGRFAVGGGGWGGGYGFGTGGFDFSAFLASTYNDRSILEGWDALGRGSMEQQKMLMLFFYFARMAMSGDLGAMYRFLQFITYLISHDKAIMNIHMASKLIELETMNRNALKELLNTPTGGAGDLDAQGQFTKQLQLTQSVQSSTATSQKLIAQMMEEMAQVVEVLTSTTKAALEANGRVLQRISMKG
jgi:hypothetical protein